MSGDSVGSSGVADLDKAERYRTPQGCKCKAAGGDSGQYFCWLFIARSVSLHMTPGLFLHEQSNDGAERQS